MSNPSLIEKYAFDIKFQTETCKTIVQALSMNDIVLDRTFQYMQQQHQSHQYEIDQLKNLCQQSHQSHQYEIDQLKDLCQQSLRQVTQLSQIIQTQQESIDRLIHLSNNQTSQIDHLSSLLSDSYKHICTYHTLAQQQSIDYKEDDLSIIQSDRNPTLQAIIGVTQQEPVIIANMSFKRKNDGSLVVFDQEKNRWSYAHSQNGLQLIRRATGINLAKLPLMDELIKLKK